MSSCTFSVTLFLGLWRGHIAKSTESSCRLTVGSESKRVSNRTRGISNSLHFLHFLGTSATSFEHPHSIDPKTVAAHAGLRILGPTDPFSARRICDCSKWVARRWNIPRRALKLFSSGLQQWCRASHALRVRLEHALGLRTLAGIPPSLPNSLHLVLCYLGRRLGGYAVAAHKMIEY